MRQRVALASLILAWLLAGPVGCSAQGREPPIATAGPPEGAPITVTIVGVSTPPTTVTPTGASAAASPTGTPGAVAPAATAGRPMATPPGPAPAGAPNRVGGSDTERLIQLARQDLSRRTGVAESEIAVVEVAAETWRDASLGCPEPGRSYAQVLTPGHRIVLEAQSRRHEYHTDSSRVVYCQRS